MKLPKPVIVRGASRRRAPQGPQNTIGTARAQRGVTLLEVLVSILIFSFGILGLVGLQARATQYSVDAEDRNRAALLADDLAAQMRMARRVDIDTTAWEQRVGAADQVGLPNGTAG